MSAALLIVWFSLLAADRVDLLAGKGPFLLSPFLVLTPIVVVVEAMGLLRRGGSFRLPPRMPRYLIAATAFLLVVGVSALFSRDMEFGVKRYALLVVMLYLNLLACAAVAMRADARRILVRGSYGGLLVGLIFNGLQTWKWLTVGGEHVTILGGTVDATAIMYGPWFPRFSGQAMDMNRAGLVFLVYVFLILFLAPPSRVRWVFVRLGALLMLATLSRSVMLAAMAMGIVVALRDRTLGLSRRGLVVVAVLVIAASSWLIVHAAETEALIKALEPITHRFERDDGSAGIHAQLIARGWDLTTRDVRNALIGVGFGNAFHYTQDLFPGNKYGNFHSVYVTLLAESGIFALALGLFLFFWPMTRSRRYAPLLAALAAFNMFYQLLTEPIFWFALAAAWSRLCEDDEPPAAVAATPRAPPDAPLALAPGSAAA
jgi:hypothetical protein